VPGLVEPIAVPQKSPNQNRSKSAESVISVYAFDLALHWTETDYVDEADPYGMEIDAIDSLRLGDVVVHSTDFAGTNAPLSRKRIT
jgi:hypothetical protein